MLIMNGFFKSLKNQMNTILLHKSVFKNNNKIIHIFLFLFQAVESLNSKQTLDDAL